MAEVLGAVASAVTLAALFTSCIEAFDMFRAAQNQATDIKKLSLKLNIEKCRLYIWGQAMGLTEGKNPQGKRPLDLCPYPELVKETLELIVEMLRNSNKLKHKYGCQVLWDWDANAPALEAPQTSVLQTLNASFDHFRIKSSGGVRQSSLAQKTYWAIHDRKKFESLVCEAKALIDGLQDITKDLKSRTVQQEMMSFRIRAINDVRTLDWVSQVCEVDYPEFSDAASTEADSISELGTLQRNVQLWKDALPPDSTDIDSDTSSVETTIARLEDMTVTEIKRSFSTYLLQAKESRRRAKASKDKDGPLYPAKAERTVEIDGAIPEPSIELSLIPDFNSEHTGSEVKINEQILRDMAEVSIDKEFKEELHAIKQWFKVLSSAERAAAFYDLGEDLESDPNQTRFFALIQNQRLAVLSSSFEGTSEKSSAKDASQHSRQVGKGTGTKTRRFSLPSSTTTQQSAKPKPRGGWAPSPLKSQDGSFPPRLIESFKHFVESEKAVASQTIDAKERSRMEEQFTDLKRFSREFQVEAVPPVNM